MFETDEGGRVWVRTRRKWRKIVGFEYSLDFLVLFGQAKRTVATDAQDISILWRLLLIGIMRDPKFLSNSIISIF